MFLGLMQPNYICPANVGTSQIIDIISVYAKHVAWRFNIDKF